MCDMIETEKFGEYNVANEGYCSWYEFARAIFDEAGKTVSVKPLSTEEYPTKAKRPYNSCFSKKELDENGFITGYECGLENMKKHIIDSLNQGENVIVGYTQQDDTGKVINGHEITIVKLEKDKNGKEVFVCNDTDDESDLPVRYYGDDLIPSIHHAGLSKYVIDNNADFEQPKYEAIEYYKSLLDKNENNIA